MTAHVFAPDRATYWRNHAWMAATAMALGMGALWFFETGHIWAGALGGLAGIAVRAWYLEDEALGERWEIHADRITGPAERKIPLANIDQVRSLGSAVQIVTTSGDKHLIKYLANPAEAVTRIEAAR